MQRAIIHCKRNPILSRDIRYCTSFGYENPKLLKKYSTNSNDAKILIVGGGIAGLTCALTLRKFNIKPIVLEKQSNSNFDHFKDTTLILQCNALRILKWLGVEDKVVAQGHTISTSKFAFSDGNVFKVIDMAKYNANNELKASCVAIQKSKLAKILAQAADVQIKHGALLTALQLMNSSWSEEELREGLYSPNTTVMCTIDNVASPGKSTGIKVNAVLVADGADSAVRNAVAANRFKQFWRKYPPWGIWYATVDKPNEVEPHTTLELWDNGRRLFIVPFSDKKAFVWGTFNMSGMENIDFDENVLSFSEAYKSFTSFGVPDIIEQIRLNPSIDKLCPNTITMDRMVFGNAILIGDASHASSPTLPQNAASAMEDAIVFGTCLGTGASSEKIHEYEMERLDRTAFLRKHVRALDVVGQAKVESRFQQWTRSLAIKRNMRRTLDLYNIVFTHDLLLPEDGVHFVPPEDKS